MTLYRFMRSVVGFMLKILFKINITGKENIPANGRLVICSNHISLLDPIMVAISTKRPVHFMGKKELFENKFLNWFLSKLNAFPVDRDGSDIRAIKTSLTILKKDGVLGVFPEGTRVNGFDKKNAKAGVAMIALKSRAPIIPVFIESEYKLFRPINVKIGEELDYGHLYGKKLSTEEYKKMSEEILYAIYSL